ncbi:Glycosyl hydrolase family 26 [Peptoclostridium litorale DSM 5388]|uniref:Endoglucanase H n=1 Tax=Peptoclostridium litorale DSM 5388 TaxID=1121324 RepID=A0A069RF36_PEPLI|nr:glycosyl hydrolase [Peptoclostridium litorale]KDR94825.1 endoglucanase H [Peptoclostridium litorale DSM 5388]SIN93508.1 Glycosyl hydrolase family 26 [Peptoclostridium litorale DSM 5388]
MKRWLLGILAFTLAWIQAFECGPISYAYEEGVQTETQIGIQEQTDPNQFVSYPAGLGIIVPGILSIEESPSDEAIRFYGPDGSSIYIYSQDIKETSAREYINYSNKQINNSRGSFRPVYEKDIKLSNGVRAVEFMYERDKIDNIENDKNAYFEINSIYPNESRVLTFWLKTDSDNLEYYKSLLNDMASSAWVFEKAKADYAVSYEDKDIDIKGENIRLKIGRQRMLWGIMHPHNLDGSDYTSNLKPFEEEMGRKFEFLMTYSDFEHDVNLDEVEDVYEDGRVIMLTWQPWTYIDKTQNENLESESTVLIPEIIKGSYDEYIRKWARDIKSIGNPVFVRFANEMNGDWDAWCAWYFGKDTELYNEAWKHLWNIFKEEGADNALFVWNPHDRSYPDFVWNNSHMYYPGDEYVDWVGLTGYNNGTSFNGDSWREFGEIYYPLYNDYMKHYSEKPFMITEFSCNEDGGDKAKWINDGFNEFANMPNIKIAVWFNQVDTKWQYNIDSSKRSYRAFQNSVNKNPHFSMKSVFELSERKTTEDAIDLIWKNH